MKVKLLVVIIGIGLLFLLNSINKTTQMDFKIKSCEKTNLPQECWNDLLKETIKTKGLDAGFDLFVKLYKTEPLSADNCHTITHTLGQAGYDYIASNKKFTRIKEGSYCRYGFYHGLLEVSFDKDKNLNLARTLCWNQEKSSKIPNSFESYQCFHGIGHGITDYYTDLGNGIQEAIDKGLESCREVSQANDHFYNTCLGGVFASTASSYIKGKYPFDLNDAFKICREQENYYEFCYIDIPAAIMVFNSFDFYKSFPIVLSELSSPSLAPAVETLSYVWAETSVSKSDFSENITSCIKLPGDLSEPCIRGFVYGLLTSGEPDNEYVKTENFCKSKDLSISLKKVCFDELIKRAKTMYSSQIFNKICRDVKPFCENK